jgi:hypothetical protein
MSSLPVSRFTKPITGVSPISVTNNAVSVDLSSRVAKSGDTMTGPLIIQNASASAVPLIVKLAASQTANGIELQSSSGTKLFSILPAGQIDQQVFTGAFGYQLAYYNAANAFGAGLSFSAFVRNNTLTSGFSATRGISANVSLSAATANCYNRSVTGNYSRVDLSATSPHTAQSLNGLFTFYADTPAISGTGTLLPGPLYGYYAANIGNSAAANAYGLFVASQSGSANNYAIYTNDGLVRFGDLVTGTKAIRATGRLRVGEDAETAAAGDIRYNTSTSKHEGFDGTNWNAFY